MFDDYMKLKNKEFAFACLNFLLNKGFLTDENLKILTSLETCHRKFCFQYPILVEVPVKRTVPREMFMDSTGNRRYYPETILVVGKRYILCNDWYYGKVRDNRTPFINWIRGFVK